ncbi:hypothetical protein CROQUDRAFT_656097 [Cronartium quercuum f. sp. fusiforme G11]|uniref:ditrans,polycis-polyprenyl diphosphate synthase [(2E,6E)-farnesyldiphosphate specific] n=1 Tax=Cronartium quercuum f. sp. fusiforme G11 TaxID=708437 RepID=A0A9P6NQ38_9BASI|nr:hypothetical protein CROQUDRAFT_656097 [Cronartium quercuum f. sp. fusiforme G11]
MIKAIEQTTTTFLLTIFLTLLHTLHFSTHAIRAIIDCLVRFRDYVEESLFITIFRPRALEEEMERLKKRANHVAVIWVPVNGLVNRLMSLNHIFDTSGRTSEEVQERAELGAMVADVERLMRWSKRAGIKELSFYDERGLLKKYQYDVLESLALTDIVGVRDSISLLPTNTGVDHVDLLPAFTLTYNAASPSLPSQTMRLNILSRRHGHQHLAQVARKLVDELRDQKNPERALDALNVKAVGEKITSTSIGPPDLIMVLGGRSLRLRGFPPWQLSLSEIYHGRSYSIWPYRVTYREFVTAMKIFGDCEQRKGT